MNDKRDRRYCSVCEAEGRRRQLTMRADRSSGGDGRYTYDTISGRAILQCEETVWSEEHKNFYARHPEGHDRYEGRFVQPIERTYGYFEADDGFTVYW